MYLLMGTRFPQRAEEFSAFFLRGDSECVYCSYVRMYVTTRTAITHVVAKYFAG